MFLTHMPDDDFGYGVVRYYVFVGDYGRAVRLAEPLPRSGPTYNMRSFESVALFNNGLSAEDYPNSHLHA